MFLKEILSLFDQSLMNLKFCHWKLAEVVSRLLKFEVTRLCKIENLILCTGCLCHFSLLQVVGIIEKLVSIPKRSAVATIRLAQWVVHWERRSRLVLGWVTG
jgi:hypothetical protein